ncbi:MAG: U32 family peptidase, partial [Firmicutes bacterium]|nr:U32 family peptidase [Bacillota bacterium]
MAPVGGEEQLKAALRCGADAVYFGLQNFNARRNADNFNGENLKETVRLCHEHSCRVYITVNTLVFDDELEEVYKAVDTAAEAGADALIIQDFAVAAYAKEHHPKLKRFASTQMAVHNSEGVKALVKWGFDRVVLARELSLKEIRDVIKETGVEAEVFVHGAHCMSLSGNCYLSSMIGGRSGNRGLCAQPCRLDCSINGRDHALSLKDMSYMDHIRELAEAGVASLKIEGRMKRTEYVAAAVTACRNAREGKPYDLESLRSVFSRSGFTDGYLRGKRTLDMFGYRTKEDVVAADGVLKSLSRLYEKEPQTVPLDMYLSVKRDERV